MLRLLCCKNLAIKTLKMLIAQGLFSFSAVLSWRPCLKIRHALGLDWWNNSDGSASCESHE